MDKRKLGNSGIEIAPLAFGGNVFGWTADEETSFRLLDAFTDEGFDFVDTADVYSAWGPSHKGGESETVIGKWLKARGGRDRIKIATKVGMWDQHKGLSKANILAAAAESLKRLQTDYIDLYQSHEDDSNTSIEETLEAYAELIKAGKVRAVGASNYSAARLSEALSASGRRDLPRYESLQPLYNLYDRAPFEAELQGLCIKENLGVITYFSLAAGFLTGKYRSEADLGQSPRGGGIKKYLDERGLCILAALDEVALSHGAKPAQVALAWLIGRPGVTAPIASATRLEQLDDLIAATRLKLTADDVAKLDEASAGG